MNKIKLLVCFASLLSLFSANALAIKSEETGFYAIGPSGGITYLDKESVPADYVLPSDGEVKQTKQTQAKSRYISEEEAEFRAKVNLVSE